MAREKDGGDTSVLERPPETTTKKPRAPAKPKAPKEPKVGTSDAKNLRGLISNLADQNAPKTSRDIEALAKETLKMVEVSQKSSSEAFRKEATKALLEFRNFMEKTDKVNAVKRDKIMGDIEKVSLDASNASFMMLSIAKQQAKNIKAEAIRESTAEKLKIRELKKSTMDETKAKVEKLKAEAKVTVAKLKADAQLSIDSKKAKLKQEKDDARFKNLERNQEFKKKQIEFATAKELANQKLKQDRADAAAQIKRVKIELNDRYKQKQLDLRSAADKLKDEQMTRNKARIQKLREIKDDLNQRKLDNSQKTKQRIQRIRDMQAEAAIKIKKMKDDAKAESVIQKMELKDKYKRIQDEANERKRKHEANANQLTDKIKDGIYDANPLIHAAVQIGSGIVGHLAKRMGDRKKEKQLNRLRHTQQTGTPNNSPNPTPAPTPPANPGQPPANDGGGMLGGLIGMLPSITSIISGIGSFFTAIPGVLGAAWKILGGGAGLRVLGVAGLVISSVLSFFDGFNNASAIFGEKVTDDQYIKRIYAGLINVVGGILSIFDSVAGWFGFAPDLQGKYEKAQVWLYNTMSGIVDSVVNTVKGIFDTVMSAVRGLAGSVGNILSYIPGAGGAAKALQAFAGSGGKGEIKAPDSPPAVSQIAAKQDTVDKLKADISKQGREQPQVAAMIDNSVKSSTTSIITQKLDTRNNDVAHGLYGYGGSSTFRR